MTYTADQIALRIFNQLKTHIDSSFEAQRPCKEDGHFMIDFKSWEFFTERMGVEDDDYPDFTGEQQVVEITSAALAGTGWEFISTWDQEKRWFTIEFAIIIPTNYKDLPLSEQIKVQENIRRSQPGCVANPIIRS